LGSLRCCSRPTKKGLSALLKPRLQCCLLGLGSPLKRRVQALLESRLGRCPRALLRPTKQSSHTLFKPRLGCRLLCHLHSLLAL
jgi:hypothetical protein